MTNTSILQYPNKKQFIITLPKSLVLAKSWKQGDKLEFIIDNKGDIIIKLLNPKDSKGLENLKNFRNKRK